MTILNGAICGGITDCLKYNCINPGIVEMSCFRQLTGGMMIYKILITDRKGGTIEI